MRGSARSPSSSRWYAFPAADGYRHDVVDPEGENAENLDEIYPVLGPLIGLPELSAP